MFKKIFHSSVIGHSPKLSSRSVSSVSEESEIITASELPKPEKRFFLRRPLRIKAEAEELSSSYFRTFDPFDLKSNLKRSSSFPTEFEQNESEPSTVRLPRSKSVHFADTLATYHEFKPHFNEDLDKFESHFEQFCRSREKHNLGESESEEIEDSNEVESSRSGSSETQKVDAQDMEETAKKKITEFISNSGVYSQKKLNKLISGSTAASTRGVRVAGEHLKSMFEEQKEKVDLSGSRQATAFDNSDSTDVESADEPDSEVDFLHEIYEQLCGLRDSQGENDSICGIPRLKSEISCCIADIGDILSVCRNQLANSNKEEASLKAKLQKVSEDLELQVSVTKSMKGMAIQLKETQIALQESKRQIAELHAKFEEDGNLAPKPVEGAKTHENFGQTQFETEYMSAAINAHQKLEELNNLSNLEKSEIVHQLDRARSEKSDLEAFQEAEKKFLSEELMKVQNDAKALDELLKEKVSIIQGKEIALEALKAAKDQHINEATLMIKEMNKRYDEKKGQVSKILECLENLRSFTQNEEIQSPTPVDLNIKKLPLIDPKAHSSNTEYELAREIIDNIQKRMSDSIAHKKAMLKCMEEISSSNKLALASLVALYRDSYEILAPIFHKDCAEQFTRIHLQLSKADIMNDSQKYTVVMLNNFILSSQRELLHQHNKNEQMLEIEIKDRLKYQQQVLDSFTEIAKQILERSPRTSGPRVSGIRAHSSPKKTR